MTDPLITLEPSPRYRTSNPISSVSQKFYPVAGIKTTVYGLDEIPADATEVACLWLLHPRLATQERMTGIANAIIADWNGQSGAETKKNNKKKKGLIAVAFDQRNHGTRLVDPLCNEAWRQGNPRHAQDMFACFQGTARDVSLLIDYLPSFVFPTSSRNITEHLVLGVSLGGHAAWSCLLHEPRITAGVIVIGCPDYVNLMVDRARLSKIPSWTQSTPPGSNILGSEAFPSSLLDTIQRYDPASLFLSYLDLEGRGKIGMEAQIIRAPGVIIPEPTEQEKAQLKPVMRSCLGGKKILNLSGGVDKLVPYHKGEAFLGWFKRAIAQDGWFADGGVEFEDIIDQSAGHDVTPAMMDEAVRFIRGILAGEDSNGVKVRESKI